MRGVCTSCYCYDCSAYPCVCPRPAYLPQEPPPPPERPPLQRPQVQPPGPPPRPQLAKAATPAPAVAAPLALNWQPPAEAAAMATTPASYDAVQEPPPAKASPRVGMGPPIIANTKAPPVGFGPPAQAQSNAPASGSAAQASAAPPAEPPSMTATFLHECVGQHDKTIRHLCELNEQLTARVAALEDQVKAQEELINQQWERLLA